MARKLTLRSHLANGWHWIRRWMRSRLRGRRFYCPEVHVPCEFLGTRYGGWWVALQEVTADSVIYSVGIGEDASFDLEIMARCGATVHAFDPTPVSLRWVRSQIWPQTFRFHEVGLSDFDGTANFAPPSQAGAASYHVTTGGTPSGNNVMAPVKRLATIMRELGHTRIDILKMDIEGSEYGALKDMVNCHIDARQLLVEFHEVEEKPQRLDQTMRMLHEYGFRIFRVSPTGLEMSLLRVG